MNEIFRDCSDDAEIYLPIVSIRCLLCKTYMYLLNLIAKAYLMARISRGLLTVIFNLSLSISRYLSIPRGDLSDYMYFITYAYGFRSCLAAEFMKSLALCTLGN